MAIRGLSEGVVLGRGDLYRVDPRRVQVKEGWNKRTDWGDMEGLSASIEAEGVKKPIVLKKLPDGEVELVDGERRLRGTLMAIERGAQIESIPAEFVRNNISDIEARLLMLLANDGKPFTPLEEALVLKDLRDLGGLSETEIARRTGRSQPTVKARLALVDGSPALREAVQNNVIPLGLAQEIIEKSAGDIEKQDALLTKATASKGGKREVRQQVSRVYAKFHEPMRVFREHIERHKLAATDVDGAIDQVRSLASSDDEKARIEAAIQTGVMKGMAIALGKRMPDPFKPEQVEA